MTLRGKPLGVAQLCHILRSMYKKPKNITDFRRASEPEPSSIFDPPEPEEADLWFLPAPEEAGDLTPFPLPRAPALPLFDAAEWVRAQGQLSGALAQLCLQFGRLEERLQRLGPGARQRLALREAAEMAWWAGERVGVERLALWIGQHLGGGSEESLALAQAGWSARRLTAGLAPEAGGWHAGLWRFLGHSGASAETEDLALVMQSAAALHPVTQAAVLFHAWRMISQGPASLTEAHALAACHAARMAGGSFLPLVTSGGTAVRASGSAEARLAGWISGAMRAVLAGLLHLDQLERWQQHASETLADLSGRLPRQLLPLLATWPLLTAPMAEALTSASRAAVQRNLDLMQNRGVIREITGQSRYRVWMAAF
jgi:hypothetical protein